ncbi:fatty acyl-AMP ligase [Amycolatopsis roodepoortensis]|uniref:Acyl-CoA synthetase (AMP-forming)/AMP-acid ligase II n=1 Tax=Amycolatopsis roodepoortensis TaxID=700274 RepID=A0ABR9LAI1_9PSEU|nr:fatty acyl-AMP ligase [Amycolatopsis roodepoortensis]MBE1577582.1 acyl-CoA synthetase (AMP-forming)/AMP-acid ligase II [Amycolatopsis roodepoortensis]
METISESVVAVHGPDDARGGESFATLLRYWAWRLGDDVAVTYLDHRAGADGRAITLSWRELDDRVDALATRLTGFTGPGDRAAILARQSVDYVVAFLGAIRAGLIAVPLFSPSLPGHAGRLAAVLADCAPRVVLTTTDGLDDAAGFLASTDFERPAVLAVDTTAPVAAGDRSWPRPEPDEVAYLQYTSGSTRTPAGVMLTHRNALTNARQACDAYAVETATTSTVSWLPLFHDMGLILGIGAPLAAGAASVLMDPHAFLERPSRWLRALSASPGAISAAPNFAYAYAASRVTEAEKSYLELSRVVSLINGSEPVLPSTIAKFHGAFEECGLRPEVHRSSYGLAEATVLVSVTEAGKAPRQVAFDRDRLAAGLATPALPGAASTTLVSCGFPAGQRIRIADPATGALVEPGRVGEIQVNGPNVGVGYWGRPADGVFGLPPIDPDSGAGWLATGDLGVRYEGELFMTGRLKDLVIVDGRNHYPQDIEQTVETHPAVRPHSAAAFAIEREDGEAAVVLVERAKGAEADLAVAIAEIRRAVSAAHGLRPHDVVFVAPGEVPRTSSGKISRALCRKSYSDGSLTARRLG